MTQQIQTTGYAKTTLDDGTYRRDLYGQLHRVDRTSGFWVAIANDIDESHFGMYDFIGVWLEPHTDRVWLDGSVWVEDLTDALALGIKHKQLAIWDCANSTEIYLNPTR